MSVRGAAKALDVSPSTIWRWETSSTPDSLTFKDLCRLAEVYGTTVERLVGRRKLT